MNLYFIALVIASLLANSCLAFKYLNNQKLINIKQSALFAKTPLVANGKRVEAEPGSSLLEATKKLGLKVRLDCKKGDCGTCTVTVAGKKIRACVGKVPPAPKLKSLIEKGFPVSVDF